eukprot:TRINITY_DN4703_c0_g2_i2.p1 TRINITY_DN4703_c0_g2~~TRINITY_DN4703_c0_g2_i2.p1  ORF type:complete len:413 (-),score=101.92 TRINITY_DN4703_c0_g2_i2:42-1241(-)
MAGLADELKAVFRKHDRNGDGCISVDEFATLLKLVNPNEQFDVKEVFEKVDQNHDGKLQFEELVDWIMGDDDVKNSLLHSCNSLADVFHAFSGGKADMDGKTFSKLCKDTGLVDKKFTNTDVDLLFAKIVTKGQRRINLQQFHDGLALIAQKKNIADIESVVLSAKGPVLNGTRAEAVRFHDDKSTYTGTHVNGGPDHVAKGAGTHADASWKRLEPSPPEKPAPRSPARPSTSAGAPAAAAPAPASAQRPAPTSGAVTGSHAAGGSLQDAFDKYCAGHHDMDGKSFAKLCKDVGLLDKKFTATDADLVFAKVVPKGARRIDIAQFRQGLKLVAEKKGVPDVEAAVAKCTGPVLHGTEADAVRFHDDKSTYTGVHVNGGPESVAKGGGTAADASWKRPGA